MHTSTKLSLLKYKAFLNYNNLSISVKVEFSQVINQLLEDGWYGRRTLFKIGYMLHFTASYSLLFLSTLKQDSEWVYI